MRRSPSLRVQPCVIREARLDDVEAAVSAYEVAWDATIAPLVGRTLDELAPRDVRIEAFRSSLEKVSDDARVWVAERAGRIVGLAVYRRDEDVGELRALFVIPEAWGSGVAQALMWTALEAMQERGLQEAILWVGEENGRARRFYGREGWSSDGTSRPSEVGPSEVRYSRPLLSA